MRKLFQAAVLVLSLSIMTASCSKSDPSSSITGTWHTQHKIAIVPDPTEAQKFVEDLRFVVFSGDNVSFKDEDKKEIGKGTYTYSVTDTYTEKGYGTKYSGKISFTGVPLKGGDFERTVTNVLGDVIKWTDVDYIEIRLKQ